MTGPEIKPTIHYDDFARLDLRVGRILSVEPFPRARNPSYKLTIDIGGEHAIGSSAQITSYTPAELVGSLVVCVCNFPPRNIAGFLSEVLVLGARGPAGEVILLQPRSGVAVGEPVF